MNKCDYDGWKTGWYDGEREPPMPMSNYWDTVTRGDYESLASCMRAILVALYSKQPLDISRLDDDIMFMAQELNVFDKHFPVPVGNPNVNRPMRKRPALTEFAIELARLQGPCVPGVAA